MKIPMFIGLVMYACICSGQTTLSKEYNEIITSPYRPANITLYCNDKKIDSFASSIASRIILKVPEPGKYKIVFSALGQQSLAFDDIHISENELKIIVEMSGRCIYEYPINYEPVCPNQHRDSILPIEYGLIARPVRKDNVESSPKFYSGGCVVTGCDPKYYCSIHKLEF